MKQSRNSSAFPSRLSMLAVACQLVCLSAYAQTTPPAETNEPSDPNRVTITGKKVGMGLMVQETAPKARSTITAEELAKQRPTGNAYEALELMPAVNSYNYDATGLFGGGLTLRGFNSDQIGATINGVPVNDSGSFSVYPQEFVDQENTCTQFVTQGSTDVDSPQIGATGGNFGITTCDPSKTKNIRLMQTVGGLNLSKTYVRYDTGMLDERSRFFISVSHAQADKWKGLGGANRDHVDMGFRVDFDRFNSINGTILYNKAINQNISTFNLADLAKNGYYYDYATTFSGHVAPTPGKPGSDANPAFADAYYQLTKNPFENVIASAVGKFRLGENTDIKVVPYFWYGYGTGGNQQRLQTESAFLNRATGKNTAGVDLNGDGDTLDKVIVANSSVTRTNRPGITASVTHSIGNNQLLAGFWFERAIHEQFGPMVAVDANGNASDIWLRQGRILRPDGTPFQSRDWKTISTAYQFFAQDTISMMDDKLTVNVGVRAPTMKRDFTNYPSEGYGIGYNIQKRYSELLPQLGARYQIDYNNSLFASLAKNMKVPPNFVYSNLPVVNGVATLPVDVKAETSYNLDIGYRLQSEKLTGQATVYSVDFRDRQATAYDPISNTSSLSNVGKVKTQGFELELGNTPVNGWSFYSSLGYAKSEIKDNLVVSKILTQPTAGKQMPLTPEWKAGLSAQYETGVWYARLKAKYTSTQQATLVNDEEIPAYTVVGFDAGYQFPNTTYLKKPTLRLSISNLFDEKYRNSNSQSKVSAAAGVFYYMGAPRLTSVTFSVDY
ncbi:TonB-dependent receptor [Undibacterium sp. Jales W-56]|uniref:TonB-dependent receptor n=1 Tax=Undibacterium sp. Jales W-56 TaxID=2897325 RepID=UPI0021D377B6|nr:TonB-dependent receptor [Undibacterium sp. Jales W-56]MCU6434856.1 TonB-dependent receptor [Undibacterium sp. Jales W-56]